MANKHNPAGWVEIPVNNMKRAKKFYESGEAFLVSGEEEIFEGQVLTTKEFGKLIAFIRKCGENLQKIVEINDEGDVRSVTI